VAAFFVACMCRCRHASPDSSGRGNPAPKNNLSIGWIPEDLPSLLRSFGNAGWIATSLRSSQKEGTFEAGVRFYSGRGSWVLGSA